MAKGRPLRGLCGASPRPVCHGSPAVVLSPRPPPWASKGVKGTSGMPSCTRRPEARPPLLPPTSLPPLQTPAPDQDLCPRTSCWATVLSLFSVVQPLGGRALPDPTAPLQHPPCPSRCGYPVCCRRPCPRPELRSSPQGVPLQSGEGPEQMGNKCSRPTPREVPRPPRTVPLRPDGIPGCWAPTSLCASSRAASASATSVCSARASCRLGSWAPRVCSRTSSWLFLWFSTSSVVTWTWRGHCDGATWAPVPEGAGVVGELC